MHSPRFETAQTQAEIEREIKISNERKVASIIRELREVRELDREEAKFLVMMYYAQQEDRIRNYARAAKYDNSPTVILMARSAELFEEETKKALKRFAESHPIGRWMMSIDGIGPVMAAGLLSFIDIKRCDVAGAIYSFAGLLPNSRPKKGEKIKYNPDLKKLCYLIGESFVKVSGKETSLYGRLYKEKKLYYTRKNENGDYSQQAADTLAKFNYGKETEAYKSLEKGRLPLAQIHARAKQYAVRIFISHLHETWYRFEMKKEPAKPYAIAILNHKDYIPPPELLLEHIEGKKKKL